MNEYESTVVSVAALIDRCPPIWQRVRRASWLHMLGRDDDALHYACCAARAAMGHILEDAPDPKIVERACWELAVCRGTDIRRSDGRTFLAMRIEDVLLSDKFYADDKLCMAIKRDHLREHPEEADEWDMRLLFWPWLDRGLLP